MTETHNSTTTHNTQHDTHDTLDTRTLSTHMTHDTHTHKTHDTHTSQHIYITKLDDFINNYADYTTELAVLKMNYVIILVIMVCKDSHGLSTSNGVHCFNGALKSVIVFRLLCGGAPLRCKDDGLIEVCSTFCCLCVVSVLCRRNRRMHTAKMVAERVPC